MNKVLACLDDSPRTLAVCDYGIWAARLLDVQLEFLHVLDRLVDQSGGTDFSGMLGFDAQENLLEQLGALDEERSRLAQEHGRRLLQAAKDRAVSAGVGNVETRQRHDSLIDTLLEFEPDTRMVIVGQQRVQGPTSKWYLDQNAERVVRTLQRPVLVVDDAFKLPQRFVIAFDGSATARKMVEMVSASPLLKGQACHLIAVTEDSGSVLDGLSWARQTLEAAGFAVQAVTRGGEPEQALREHVMETGADLLVMGAYGHSRIRHLIMGSTTSVLLRTSPVPVLILR